MLRYQITRQVNLRRVPGGHEVHYAEFSIQTLESGEDTPKEYHFLDVPCRSRLNHLLTGLFFNFKWDENQPAEITEEEYQMLKHLFTSQKEYKLWKTAMEKIDKEGVKAAKQWLVDQVKVLAVRNLLRGKRV